MVFTMHLHGGTAGHLREAFIHSDMHSLRFYSCLESGFTELPVPFFSTAAHPVSGCQHIFLGPVHLTTVNKSFELRLFAIWRKYTATLILLALHKITQQAHPKMCKLKLSRSLKAVQYKANSDSRKVTTKPFFLRNNKKNKCSPKTFARWQGVMPCPPHSKRLAEVHLT